MQRLLGKNAVPSLITEILGWEIRITAMTRSKSSGRELQEWRIAIDAGVVD